MNYAEFVKPHYEPGEVINSGRPYAYVIWSSARGRYCDHCAAPAAGGASLERCEGCATDCYCGPECRRAAWASFHRFECPLLDAWRRRGKSADELPDMTRMLFRALARRHFEKLLASGDTCAIAAGPKELPQFPSLDDPGWRKTFDDLLSHEKDIQARPEAYLDVLNALDELCGGDAAPQLVFALPPRDEVLATFGRIRTNWCELYDQELHYVGGAVYLSPSVVNHSCSPNSVFIINGLRVDWRATRSIDTAAGDQPSLDYVINNALATTAERKKFCREHYFFDCGCSLCNGSEAALRRDRRLTSLRCAHGDDCRKMADCEHCNGASADASSDERTAAESEARSAIKAAREAEARGDHSAAAELAARYLDGEQRLGVCNVLVVRVREALVRACIELSQSKSDRSKATAAQVASWMNRGEIEGRLLLDVYRLLYYSPAWPVGKLCYDLGLLVQSNGKVEEAAAFFVEALTILRITHGSDHGLVRQTEQLVAQCTNAAQQKKIQHQPIANSQSAIALSCSSSLERTLT